MYWVKGQNREASWWELSALATTSFYFSPARWSQRFSGRKGVIGPKLASTPSLLLLFLLIPPQTASAEWRNDISWRKGKECKICTIRNDRESNSIPWHRQKHTQEQQQAIIKLIIRLILMFLFFFPFWGFQTCKQRARCGQSLWSRYEPYHAANKCFNAVLLASPGRIRGAGVVFVTWPDSHMTPWPLCLRYRVGWRWCFEDGGQTCFSQAWAAICRLFPHRAAPYTLWFADLSAGARRVPVPIRLFPLRHNELTAFVVCWVSRYLGNEWTHNREGLPYKSNYSVGLIYASRCFHVLTSVVTRVIWL